MAKRRTVSHTVDAEAIFHNAPEILLLRGGVGRTPWYARSFSGPAVVIHFMGVDTWSASRQWLKVNGYVCLEEHANLWQRKLEQNLSQSVPLAP